MRNIISRLPIGSEHRWGERVRVDLPVAVLVDGRAAQQAHLKNLSLSGALLKSSDQWPLNSPIGVRIMFPPTSVHATVVKARVSRRSANGMGVEWCDFAPAIVKEVLRSPAREPR